MEAQYEASISIIENPLSDEELDAICREPIIEKDAIFGPGSKWFRHNWFMLDRVCPGEYVLVNVQNFSATSGKSHDEASRAYNKKFGPAPPQGRNFIGKQL